MATTQHAARLHESSVRRHLDKFRDLHPGMTNREREEIFIKEGVYDVSILKELNDSAEHKVKRDSRNGRDLADGSNSKFSAGYGWVNGQQTALGWIIKVANCEADVLAEIVKPSTKEVWEGRIPASAIGDRRFITITDCKNGGPLGGKWGKYLKKVECEPQFTSAGSR
jgi:hypothetical protein